MLLANAQQPLPQDALDCLVKTLNPNNQMTRTSKHLVTVERKKTPFSKEEAGQNRAQGWVAMCGQPVMVERRGDLISSVRL